ncbi:hypothetical protein DOJK_01630 [Patescibacteria group bacterium]|nr:hypothetical protein DOJK_01630 [Patescibacteria group bacterium]
MSGQTDKLEQLKRLAATVYLCQVLMFGLFGLPLLVGVAINFLKRKEAEGTWIESHFEWQIKTAWVVLAGFAIGGLIFETGLVFYLLVPVIMWTIYRIVLGWHALNNNKGISGKMFP